MKLRVTHKWNSNYSKTPVIGSAVNTAALNMTKVTDYIGNKVYEQGVLKKILVDGGYIEDGKYYFTLQDHLGNTRMVLSQDGSIVQREYYYPFEMTVPHIEYDGKHPYRYNGKELDQMHRLDLYDYSARYYDQAIGRFTTVDPLAESYYSISPYEYVGNNPIKRTDPTGMDWFVNGENGNVYFIRNLTNLKYLRDDQAEFLGIDRNNISHYENLGGDDLIDLGFKPFYHIVDSDPGRFMSQKGFAAVDRVRVEETTTESKYTEGDGSYRTAGSYTITKEIARYKSYIKEGQTNIKDLGGGRTSITYDLPELYKGKEISSKSNHSFAPIDETVKIIDYKVPQGGYYRSPTNSANEKSNFIENFTTLLLSIFNAYMDNKK